MVKFWPKVKISFALGIKNWGFQLKRVGEGSENKKMHKMWKVKPVDRIDQAIDQTRTSRPIHRDWGFKKDSRASFSPLFSSISSGFFTFRFLEMVLSKVWTNWRLWIGFLGRLEARVLTLECILFLPHVTVGFFSISTRLGFWLCSFPSWLCSFLSLLAPSSVFCFFSWLQGESRVPLRHRAST